MPDTAFKPNPANTNCLSGFRCPNCGQTEEFRVVVIMTVSVFDNGTSDAEGDTEWDDNSDGTCPGCGHTASAKEFFDHTQAWLDKAPEGVTPVMHQTWTFVGHWDNDRIVVEYVLPGDQQDVREDTGFWEQGLFAAAGTGATQAEALATVREEYEKQYNEED